MDGTKVFQQGAATSSTVRTQHASGASGAPWSGAINISARAKVIEFGNSNQAALVCPRYTNTSNFYCVALVESGVQIQTAVNGASSDSAVFSAT